MKKALIPLLLCLCVLSACGSAAADPGMAKLTEAVSSAAGNDAMASPDADFITHMMKLAEGDYDECSVYTSTIGTSVDEYGIFKGKDAAQADAIKAALDAYLEFRLDAWMPEYLPEEFPKLQNAEVWQQGNYVLFAILGDAQRAAVRDAFEGCF